MASYAGTLGKLNIDQALKDINNASNIGTARSVVKQFMSDATKLGVTNNDQSAVAQVLSQFAYNYRLFDDADMIKLINSWDPNTKDFKSANVFNASDRVDTDYTTLQNIISSYNYDSNGATTKKTQEDIIKKILILKQEKYHYQVMKVQTQIPVLILVLVLVLVDL